METIDARNKPVSKVKIVGLYYSNKNPDKIKGHLEMLHGFTPSF